MFLHRRQTSESVWAWVKCVIVLTASKRFAHKKSFTGRVRVNFDSFSLLNRGLILLNPRPHEGSISLRGALWAQLLHFRLRSKVRLIDLLIIAHLWTSSTWHFQWKPLFSTRPAEILNIKYKICCFPILSHISVLMLFSRRLQDVNRRAELNSQWVWSTAPPAPIWPMTTKWGRRRAGEWRSWCSECHVICLVTWHSLPLQEGRP